MSPRTTLFSAAKDALTGAAARNFIGKRLERYGTVRDLRIDSRRKTLTITCDLLGESEPITVKVGRYETEQRGGKLYLRAHECTCSRPWIQRLLEDFVAEKEFELPGWVVAAL